MKPPKTPIEFDYDLWKTEDGICMVRVKLTGEECCVDEQTFRLLRNEEKRLRRSKGGITAQEHPSERNALLSTDYISLDNSDDDMQASWLIDPVSLEDSVTSQDCCEKYNVPYALALAIAEVESHFDPDAKSSTNDFGLMQINAINLDWLRDMGMDPLTPAGNIESGVYIIAQHLQAYGDPELALMAYNNGQTGATKLWNKGIYQTGYSQKVMAAYEKWTSILST